MSANATSVPIGQVTFAQAVKTLGPYNVDAGQNWVELTLDIAAMITPITVRLDYSADNGATWRVLGSQKITGLAKEPPRRSEHQYDDRPWNGVEGDPPVPILTASGAMIRALVTTLGGFTSQGGALALYQPVASAT